MHSLSKTTAVNDLDAEIREPLWRPILDGEIREHALASVRAIATELARLRRSKVDDPSLAGGWAGLALLYAYCGRAEPGNDDDEIARECLARAFDGVAAMRLRPGFFSGFTGVAWAAEHLHEQLFEAEDDDSNEAVDEALIKYLSGSPWQDDYDLVSGLVGIGVYALERLPRLRAVEILERIVERLNETAERKVDGTTWLTRPALPLEEEKTQYQEGVYDLGLAHGVPGVIALLAGICAAGVALEKARPLLDGAVAWFLRQKPPSTMRSTFSNRRESGLEPGDCRLAWCYGDAGVAAALFVAARSVNESDWEREALVIARHAARRPPESAGVKDAGLCHGSAGLGHIFNRLFQATGEEVLRKAARYWFEHALEMKRMGAGICGFQAYRRELDGKEYWEDELGILGGAAGIALTLLAAATEIEPAWDRMLLVSLPVRTAAIR